MLAEFVGADAKRAGKNAGIGEVVERMTQVNDEGWRRAEFFGLVEHLFQLGGFEAEFTDLLEELALLPDAMSDEAENHDDEDVEGEMAKPLEERDALFGEIAEEAPSEDEGFAPDKRTGDIPREEARERHAGLAGDGGGNGGEAGNEFREQKSNGATTGEVALGFADAGGSFKGEAAEQLEDAVAVASAEREPDGVGNDAGEEHCEGDADPTDAMRGAERACSEEDWNAGDGDADLLYQYP